MLATVERRHIKGKEGLGSILIALEKGITLTIRIGNGQIHGGYKSNSGDIILTLISVGLTNFTDSTI
ncbi:MAG: hypothetical protein HY929_00465 [Euryarchaeota archaeon]|nr:hypothetical protein [Euryarchaeota archaeon]